MRADRAIQAATAECQSAESMVSRAARSGASPDPGGLTTMTGPYRDRYRTSTSSNLSSLRNVNRSTSEDLPNVAVRSLSRSSPDDRRYSTGGRGSLSISRRASAAPRRRAM